MAKKNETAGKTATTEITVDNVMDSIKETNKMPENLAEEVTKKIADEEKEFKASQLKECILRARFQNTKELLQLRQRRREEKATKEALSKSKELQDQLCDGKITVVEYKKLDDERRETKAKAFREASKVYDEEYAELKNQHPSFRCYCWWD